jgi:dihydropyrimidinase
MDLVIRNGTVVTTGGRARASIGVEHGRIVQVGGQMPRAAREIDATDMYVLPGGVDPHVHLSTAGVSNAPLVADDLYVGTRAAAAGGVTTICDFAYQVRGAGLRSAVDAALDGAATRAVIDYSFHPVVYEPSDAALADLPALIAEGFLSYKFFTVNAGFERNVPEYLRFFEALAGRGALAMLHCEDRSIIDFCTGGLLSAGLRGVEHYPRSRPPRGRGERDRAHSATGENRGRHGLRCARLVPRRAGRDPAGSTDGSACVRRDTADLPLPDRGRLPFTG